MPITKHKHIDRFWDSKKYLKHRNDIVTKSLSKSWDDGHASDLKTMKKQLRGVFFCKWCGQEMYPAEYSRGEIVMSCRKTLCPGNIDGSMQFKVNPLDVPHREMTNQYIFDSRCRF